MRHNLLSLGEQFGEFSLRQPLDRSPREQRPGPVVGALLSRTCHRA